MCFSVQRHAVSRPLQSRGNCSLSASPPPPGWAEREPTVVWISGGMTLALQLLKQPPTPHLTISVHFLLRFSNRDNC